METIYDALHRIMQMVAEGKPQAVTELDALAKRVDSEERNAQLRQYALQLALGPGTSDEVVDRARKYEEYLRA